MSSKSTNNLLERKFIVFESCLTALFALCALCHMPCRVILDQVLGSLVVVRQVCVNGHTKIWSSQPSHGGLPLGNLAIAAGILFSGASPVKALNTLKSIRVKSISLRTFDLMQSTYLNLSVSKIWSKNQSQMLNKLKGKPDLALGGDGRCCSPGHTAKYGSYTIMDLETSKVLDMQLVQVHKTIHLNF